MNVFNTNFLCDVMLLRVQAFFQPLNILGMYNTPILFSITLLVVLMLQNLH